MANMNSPAKSQEIRRGAEALVCCAICTDTFKHPKVLPCQHTFCLACLRQFYESCNKQRVVKLSNFPCPQCRKVTYLPSGGLESLPTDFKINQIQDFLDKLQFPQEGGEESVCCDVCKFDDNAQSASSYCVQCAKNLCTQCEQHHANTTLFRDHNTVSIGTGTLGTLSALECPQHHEDIRYYCVNCHQPLCTVCALSKHAQHNITGIDSALSQQRDGIKQYLAEAQGKLSEHELVLDEIGKVREDQEGDYGRVQSAVKNHVIAVVNCIKEQEADILDKIQCGYHDTVSQLSGLEQDTEAAMKRIGDLCVTASRSLEPRQSLHLLEEHVTLVEQLKEESGREVATIPGHLRHGTTFMPNSGFEIGTVTWENDDDVSLQHVERKLKALTPSPPPPTTPSSIRLTQHDSYSDEVQFSPDLSTKYSIHLKWKAQYFYDNKDVAFMPDGSLSATDYKNGGDRVKIYDTLGNLRHWVQGNSRSIIKPWGITMNSLTNHLIITDHGDQSVKILDANLEVAHVWRNAFTKPCGVAVTKSGKFVSQRRWKPPI